jgi:hypothetical protein
MSDKTADMTSDLMSLVRASSRTLPLADILRGSPQELLGVSTPALASLKTLEINTVFDLSTSQVFAAATKIVAAASDKTSAIYQFGSAPSDLVKADEVADKPLAELQFAPIKILQGIPDASADNIATSLDTATVRDMSLYPPYRAAVRIMTFLYFPGSLPTNDPEEPTDLIPRSGEYPIEKVQYSTLLLGDINPEADELLIDVNSAKFKPLDLGKLALENAGFKTVAFGALLTFTQSWFAQGVTLGQLLHSVTLAPGESTRIAVIDWSRKSSASQAESISESNSLTNDTTHSRSINEVTDAVARESQSGFSENTNKSVSTQKGTSSAGEISSPLGGLFGGVSGSVGTTSSEATAQGQSDSYSTTTGSRDVASSMLQSINDRTHQNAHDSRDRRASVVKEVSQSEHEEVSTRVIANYNHMHALSVQYYEVVQVFRVEVKLSKVDKVVFIPVQLPDFNDDNVIRRFQNAIFRAALTLDVRNALQSLDAVEISPEPQTHFSVFSVPLNQLLKTALLTRTSLTASALRAATSELVNPPAIPAKTETTPAPTEPAPTTPAPAVAPEPSTSAITPRDLAINIGMSNLPVRISDALPVVHQVNNHLWSADQVSRLSGILNTSLLRSDSNSLFLPADVLVEGGLVASGGVPLVITFHTQQGGTVTSISPDNPIRLSDATSISLKGSHATLDISATLTLTVNRNGVRFPVQLPAVTIPKATQAETIIVRVKAGGINANLKQHLNANRMYYGQAILRALDSTQIALLLSGYGIRLGDELVPVAQIVDPKPIRYVANFLAFKANAASDDEAWVKWLKDHDITVNSATEDVVPLGSGGVFAEAILGRSNCAEKLDITRFWNWQDSPAPLQPSDIAAVQTGSRATAENVTPGQLSNPIINITSPTSLPDPTGTAAILAAIQNGNMFRDQSGLQATIGLTQAALQATSAGAATAGQQAGTNMNSLLQANTERQKTAAAMITDLAKTAAAMYTGGAIGGGGSSGGGGGGGNHSQDGAKINYFDKMQGQGSGSSTSGSSSGSGGGSVVGPGGQSGGGTTTASGGGGSGGYSQNPAALAATWGQSQPATSLLDQVVQHISSGLGTDASASSSALTSRKAWPHLDETTVLSRINDLQKDANLFNQGIFKLCTAAAFFHHIIQKNPNEFARFSKELFGAGMSFLGKFKVAPGSDLRNADYGALASKFTTLPPQADWMLMSSVRDSENWFFDFEGSPDEDTAIESTAKELSEWYKDTGFYSDVTFNTDLDPAKIKAIVKTNNNQVALWIQVSLLPGDSRKDKHIITVEGPITIDEAQDKVSFKYWTWAQPVLLLETTFTSLKQNLLGYITLTF